MFFAALDRLRRGCAGLRVRRDRSHPAHVLAVSRRRAIRRPRPASRPPHRDAIRDLYRHNDALVGACWQQLSDGDVLMVISDHGFSSFRRGVNLNAWLLARGLSGAEAGRRRQRRMAARRRLVDDARLLRSGSPGMFLNLAGREAQGIVEPGAEAAALKAEIIAQADAVCRDAETDAIGIREAFDTARALRRALPRKRARPPHRLQRRLSRLLGLRDRRRRRARCSRTTSSRGAATTASIRGWCPACSSAIGGSTTDRPVAHRHCADGACGCSGSQPPPHMDGRPMVGRRMSRYAARRCSPWLLRCSLAAARWPAATVTFRSDARVIVLGFDGLDYELTRELIAAGPPASISRGWPRCGGFAPLETTMPPQSPVAWSTFITGLDPGGHGIFDFVHRDPKTMTPYLSTTRTEPAGRTLMSAAGNCRCRAGRVELAAPRAAVLGSARGTRHSRRRSSACRRTSRRRARPRRELSGMGTPDLLGTYGTFSLLSRPSPMPAIATLRAARSYPVDDPRGASSARRSKARTTHS